MASAAATSPGIATRREPYRSINIPTNGDSTPTPMEAMDTPADTSVRLQPNSLVRGAMKTPIDAVISEK